MIEYEMSCGAIKKVISGGPDEGDTEGSQKIAENGSERSAGRDV